jgi:benzoyl-CoA reductase/2-hydroxyglutaryl-CoA dehydratase subunit BcrC/BadD/HgdB
LEELVGIAEGITDRPLDRQRLRESIHLSQEASDLWTKVLQTGFHRPSPMTVFDQFIAMAPIVSQRGTQVAARFYRTLLEELEHRVDEGTGAVDGERFRLFWDNLPIWPELRRLSLFLSERGASLVASLYTWSWAGLAVTQEDPFTDWAEQYLYMANLHLERRIQQYVEFAGRYHLDGFLYHSNRSCKMVSQDIPELRRAVTDQTGIPGVILEADHNDPRLYSAENLESQIQSFLELLDARERPQ